MRESYYLSLISGQRKGVLSTLLRGGLQLAEPFYTLATSVRNRLFDSGVKKSYPVSVPVISVGNITTGGTGKTPTVAWLIKSLQQQNYKPAILSRGYRSLDGEENDEKRLLDQLCPSVPHIQNPNRVAGAEELIQQHQPDVIVLDDGFQHRHLQRDFNLVLIDALNPFGFNHLLPRGLLRESLHGLKRAQAVLITRCDQVSEERLKNIRQRIETYTNAPIYLSEFLPTGLVNAVGVKVTFEEMNSKRTCSFAGIGNPSGFRRTLSSVGLAVSDKRFQTFPDHHHYTAEDLNQIQTWATEQNAEALIVTRKDLVKLKVDKIGPFPLWAVDIELKIQSGQEELLKLIDDGRVAVDNLP